MRSSALRSSRISSTTARYSVSSSRADRWRRLVGALVDVDAEPAVGSGLRRAEQARRRPATLRPRRRRAAGRSRPPRRPCRPSRSRPRAAARAARAPSPTSTGSVTVMCGKTTVSSRGMSRYFSTVGFTLLSRSDAIVATENEATSNSRLWNVSTLAAAAETGERRRLRARGRAVADLLRDVAPARRDQPDARLGGRPGAPAHPRPRHRGRRLLRELGLRQLRRRREPPGGARLPQHPPLRRGLARLGEAGLPLEGGRV